MFLFCDEPIKDIQTFFIPQEIFFFSENPRKSIEIQHVQPK